jgi:transcription-repair coupling factor (superfamily II helicase)
VNHLLQIVAIKALCRRANIEKLDAGPKGVVLSFRDNIFSNPDGLFAFIRERGADARVRNEKSGQKLVFLDDWENPEERLKGATAILRRLAGIAEQAKAA